VAIWFTADTHFGHANIIRYCNRPFPTVEAMNDALIDRINALVKRDDTLYHLGDFAFRTANPAAFRERICCKAIHLIMGNHDPHSEDGIVDPVFASLFASVRELRRIRLPIAGMRRPVILCHYAMRVWDASHHGAWHLFGHSHGTLPDDPHARSWDVGVDNNNYEPVSVERLEAIMAKKLFRPVDSHRDRTPSGSVVEPERDVAAD
jgi:calcineurin-like phosphoesterase family protein